MKKIFILLLLLFISKSLYAGGNDSLRIEKMFDLSKISEPKLHPKTQEINNLLRKFEGTSYQGYIYYHWSLFMYYQSQIDSAMSVAKKGVSVCAKKEIQKSNTIKLYNLVASFYTVKQNYPIALKNYQNGLNLSEELGDKPMGARINCNMANLYFSLLDYPKAYQHSKSAFELIRNFPDDSFYASILSVLALSESKLGMNEKGEVHAKMALESATATNNLTALVVSNHSLGEIYFNEIKADLAKDYFQKSLDLSKEMGNTNFIILNNVGLLHTNLLLQKYKEAISHGEEALTLSKSDMDKTRLYAIKKELAQAYKGNKQFDLAYQMMFEAHQNYATNNNLEIQKSMNELKVRFETEKKEKELAQNSLDLLEKESALQRVVLYSALVSIALIGLLALLFFIRYRNRKRIEIVNKQRERQVLEAVLNGEETERERISHELHDGLASALTAARYKLESIETTQKSEVIQLKEILQNAHEDTRRLSHKLAPLRLEKLGLVEAFHIFSTEYSSESCVINFTDLTNNLQISKDKSIILYRVCQELVQNAMKHANASLINLQISNESNWFSIIVEDNGDGFDSNEKLTSNGLGSIQKRVDQLDGEFYFDSSLKKGTVAIFKIPIN